MIFANPKEERGQKLCSLTEEVFDALNRESRKPYDGNYKVNSTNNLLLQFKNDSDPDIAFIAKKFINSFAESNENKENLADAVSSLGRLLKCSVDDNNYRTDTAFLLHKKDLNVQIEKIESHLHDRFPKKTENFHKLMIESLAEQEYDLALYAYLKIAQSRCQ